MNQVIHNLKEKEIIYRKSVEVLKAYIENKYPEAKEQFRAQVFADAIHKIIDDHIREFRRADQRKIKQELLLRTASKDNFEIVAYDIMKTCVSLDINEETFVSNLTSWINRQQEIPVYRNQINALTELVRDDLTQGTIEPVEQVVVQKEVPNIVIKSRHDDQTAEIIENNKLSASIAEDLLGQLVAAFEYEPAKDSSSKSEPELYTQGVINEAYEAEIRKEHDETSLEEEISTEDSLEEIMVVDDDFIINDLEIPPLFVEEDQRPVIKVEMEPEPYFSVTPEVGEDVLVKSTTIRYSREKIIIAVIGAVGILLIIALVVALVNNYYNQPEAIEEVTRMTTSLDEVEPITEARNNEDAATTTIEMNATSPLISSDHLHERLQFKEVNQQALKAWFFRNDSMIGQSPYFEIILDVAEDYGVNPLLLFAITGQEQGFVPLEHEFAELIINNPFNVYGSWETYNTHLEESTQIAARTILTASEERPNHIDPVEWINQTYAEDENWSTGVNIILEQLEAVAGK